MSWTKRIRQIARALLRKQGVEQELADEVRFHLERQAELHIAAGMAPREAREKARREFGGAEQFKEECRDARGSAWIENLLQDARFGARMLRRAPGFTAIAVLTLALGIGANTSIFSVLEAQLWKPLPFPDSERLVLVSRTDAKHPTRTDLLSGPDFADWEPQARSAFESVCAFEPGEYHTLPGAEGSERVTAEAISSSFFDTLRAPLAAGRAFEPDEHKPGRNHEVILSYLFWQSHFGRDAKAVGQSLFLDGVAYTIVGIAPQGLRFEFFGDPALYVPLVLESKELASRTSPALFVVARLKPSAPLTAAQTQMDVIAARLASQYPQEDSGHGINVENLRESLTSYMHGGLFFFAGAAGLVLLIACANVSSLLLVRGLARQREFAVRAALGARRSALVRQLLVEGAMLGALGGALGILVAAWGARAFDVFLPGDLLGRKVASEIDGRVLAFALAISMAAAIASALAPALFGSRTDLNDALRQSGRSISGGRGQKRVRSALVVAEVTMAVALLFGAGLFLNSFVRLQEAPLGFDPHNLISLNVFLPKGRYAQPQQIRLADQQIADAVRAVPGITGVTLASQIPFRGGIGGSFTIVGRPQPASGEEPHSLTRSVTPSYFQLLKIRSLAGRLFTAEDTENSPRVVIVNQNLVRRYFGGQDPVGTELDISPEPWGEGIPAEQFRARIVGVVENTHMFGPDEVPFSDIYVPAAQTSAFAMFLVASTNLPSGAVFGPIRKQIAQMDRSILVSDMATMEERADDALRGARGNLALIGIFAGLAVALVAVGIFGAIAYFVQQRTREFGIRQALGATRARILLHALAQSAALGVSGLALGIGVSLALGRVLRSTLYLVPGEHDGLLYGVSIYDPRALLAACALLALVLALASYVPARRATRVDPMVALRYE